MSPFDQSHYAEIKALLSPEICQLVYDYVCLRRDTGTMLSPDRRVEGADRLYCDMLTETLLAQKQPAIEQAVCAALWPSYSYVRLHHRGAVLAPHRDREASEIAVTIAIGGDRNWPICFTTDRGDVTFALEPGDAIVYDGRKLSHWRDPFEGEIQIQAMLFYVRQDGAHASARYDGRPGVGYPWVPPRQPLHRRAMGKLKRLFRRSSGRSF
ncbi:MAG TPA: hypothetical protein VES67_23615 [Vicinamibacterales bacterium]|nr:hypothetical protein [Vicinamibacterales bacterium]